MWKCTGDSDTHLAVDSALVARAKATGGHFGMTFGREKRGVDIRCEERERSEGTDEDAHWLNAWADQKERRVRPNTWSDALQQPRALLAVVNPSLANLIWSHEQDEQGTMLALPRLPVSAEAYLSAHADRAS